MPLSYKLVSLSKYERSKNKFLVLRIDKYFVAKQKSKIASYPYWDRSVCFSHAYGDIQILIKFVVYINNAITAEVDICVWITF